MWITRKKSKRKPIHSVNEMCIGFIIILRIQAFKFLIFSVSAWTIL